MGEDEWIQAAMTDDMVVVELLMRFNQSESQEKHRVRVAPPLEWGVRQARSRQVLRSNILQVKKEDESTRASPTTPLSWSAGTSTSGGGGGCEESSQPIKRPSGRRSKVNGTSQTTKRRSRKKKTLSELKEEESVLLKERIYLEKELASLRIVRDEQRTRNKSLKKMKFDLQSQLEKQTSTTDALKESSCDQSYLTSKILPTRGMCDKLAAAVVCSPSSLPNPCEVQKNESVTLKSLFVLPDLNLPVENDSSSEVLYGMS